MAAQPTPNLPATGGMTTAKSAFAGIIRGDTVLALALVTILAFMLIPIPTFLLDMGLAISILFSVFILMLTLSIKRPLEFSTFPTVLLISTALRLGLNIAATRLILAHGHDGTDSAGHIIEAFGGLIISGSYIVGGIVFAILVIINFVVITKGSGRIAEVAARFSLDAMPGKQMAIDSDLSSGLITEEEAKQRRKDLEQESNFFGAMD
ncbi:MAG TPA: FHIPEP family type III secretion protein, partial [Micavibrio sp.]|nr:FHIPEP family type III secretion protein [Micavibrio sp.]